MQNEKGMNTQNIFYSVEDTVRYQIGGNLFHLNISPTDSITVIETFYSQSKEGDLYREYHFIVHNPYSNAHLNFAYSTLDSIYNSYKTNEWYREVYENHYKPLLASRQTIQIDSSVNNFNGYWVYLREYGGDYYLDDRWSWHPSFCIADSIFTNHYMDGPDHKKILEVIPIEPNGISISFGGDPKRIESVDVTRHIYRLIDKQHNFIIAPARAIHNFEIIQYTNNTGELIKLKY
jgi:hypothetical protein